MYVSDVAIAIIRKFIPSFILLHIFSLHFTVLLNRFYFTYFIHSFILPIYLSIYLSTIILMNLCIYNTITYSKEHSFPIDIRKSEVLIGECKWWMFVGVITAHTYHLDSRKKETTYSPINNAREKCIIADGFFYNTHGFTIILCTHYLYT